MAEKKTPKEPMSPIPRSPEEEPVAPDFSWSEEPPTRDPIKELAKMIGESDPFAESPRRHLFLRPPTIFQPYPTFGSRFRTLRKARQQTQEQVAKEIGVAGAAVSQWENDETTPTNDNVKKIGKHFGVDTIEWLVNGEGPQPTLVRIQDALRHQTEKGEADEEYANTMLRIMTASETNVRERLERYIAEHNHFIDELVAKPVQGGEPSRWLVPPNALPVASTKNIKVVQSSLDLDKINRGDFLFVDCNQNQIVELGYWLAQLQRAKHPMLIQSRANPEHNELGIVSYAELVIDPAEIAVVLGRVVARYEALAF
jgi:transcriptional regulator with XRE-family HTH domain